MNKWEEETRDRAVEVAEAALLWRKADVDWEELDFDDAPDPELAQARQVYLDAESNLLATLDAYQEAKRRAESAKGVDGGG